MKNIKSQLRLMFNRESFIFTMTAMIIFSVFSFVCFCIKSYGLDLVSVKSAKYLYLGSDCSSSVFFQILLMLIPLVTVIPFADSFFEERRNKTIEFCILKASNKSYYFSKLCAVFVSGFLVIAVPLIINTLLNLIAFPLNSTITSGNTSIENSGIFSSAIKTLLFEELFAKNMYLYNLVYCFISSLAGGLMAVAVFQFSFFYKANRTLLLCSLFLIYNFYSIVFQAFGLNEFCLENYIFAGRYFCGQSLRGMFVTFFLLLSSTIVPIPFAIRKLSNCYD